MAGAHGNIRLHLATPLRSGANIQLEGRLAHYLGTVMRVEPGQAISVFNAVDGEWRAEIIVPQKKSCEVLIKRQTRAPAVESGPWVAVAGIRRERLELLTEKATELGTQHIQLTLTHRTSHRYPSVDRLRAIATEAAEQCGRLTIPEITAAVPLGDLLRLAEPSHRLFVLDPGPSAIPLAEALVTWMRTASASQVASFIVGPEGGWTEGEVDLMLSLPHAVAVSLGWRVLRTETAVIAALACYQAIVDASLPLVPPAI